MIDDSLKDILQAEARIRKIHPNFAEKLVFYYDQELAKASDAKNFMLVATRATRKAMAEARANTEFSTYLQFLSAIKLKRKEQKRKEKKERKKKISECPPQEQTIESKKLTQCSLELKIKFRSKSRVLSCFGDHDNDA